MQATTLDSFVRQMTIRSIEAYQVHLSPKKGFSCPHRLLHEGESCSSYVKEMFTTNNFLSAVQMSRKRFSECAAAAQNLKGQQAGFRCIILPCCFPI